MTQRISVVINTWNEEHNLPWSLGGYDYGGSINQIFYGYVGDVRIVNRALPVSQFMINS